MNIKINEVYFELSNLGIVLAFWLIKLSHHACAAAVGTLLFRPSAQ